MPPPQIIDGLQFARDGYVVRGSYGLESLERLAGQGCTAAVLEYSLSGGMNDEGTPYIAVRVKGDVDLVCQRCLGKLKFPIDVDSKVVLAKDWQEVIEADDDAERVLAEKDMPVSALVEDEIILSLPMVPRHVRCEENGIDAKAARSSPFDVLAALKRPPGRQH
jgi:uncharacterized protein